MRPNVLFSKSLIPAFLNIEYIGTCILSEKTYKDSMPVCAINWNSLFERDMRKFHMRDRLDNQNQIKVMQASRR